jgi:hypothetical protein
MQDGEVAIPSISTEDIYKWITNTIKIRIVENLIINNKNPTPGLQSMLQLWLQQERQLFLAAKSESNWSGMGNWQKGYKRKMQIEMNSYNLPKR